MNFDIDLIEDALNEIKAVCSLMMDFRELVFNGSSLNNIGHLIEKECNVIARELKLQETGEPEYITD